jgi:hypothetical protein
MRIIEAAQLRYLSSPDADVEVSDFFSELLDPLESDDVETSRISPLFPLPNPRLSPPR